MARRRVWVLAVALLGVTPHSAYAIQEGVDSKFAFIVTTAFLTLVPLAIAGGVFIWFRKRVREMREEELEDLVTGPREAE